MGRSFTISFKDNKVSRVTGSGSTCDKAEAALFAQAFVDQVVAVKLVVQEPQSASALTADTVSDSAVDNAAASDSLASVLVGKVQELRVKVKYYCGWSRAWCLTLACDHIVKSGNVKVPRFALCAECKHQGPPV